MNHLRRSAIFAIASMQATNAMSNSARKITWDDLISQDPKLDFERMFSCWPKLPLGRVKPIGMSSLGCCFFERPDGTVHGLDPLQGSVRKVAESSDAFARNMNESRWQDENLHPGVVRAILDRGLVRSAVQVFGFAPHPRFGGGLNPIRAVVLDAQVWHSISAQSF